MTMIFPKKTLFTLLVLSSPQLSADHGPALNLDQLEVTAQQLAPAGSNREDALTELRLTPGGVTLVDMNSVKEGHVASLADMLRYVPGVWAASDSGNDELFLSSRGSNLDATDFDMNGVKLLQDGLPVTSADGNNHNRIIDPLSAQYATVARGANAMKYGASTLGGAIDFATPTAYDLPRASLLSSVGSHGSLQNRLSVSDVFDNGLDASLTLEDKRWEGYRDHNEQQRFGIYANAGLALSNKVSTRFYLSHLENDQELPGALTRQQLREDRDQASPNAELGDYQRNVKTFRLANKTTIDFDANRRLEFGVAFEEQELDHPIVFNPFFNLYIQNRQRDASTMARYYHRIDDHQLLFGVNYGVSNLSGGQYNNDFGKRGTKRADIENDASTLELYAMDRWNFADNWTLVGGVQLVSAEREVQQTDLTGSGRSSNPNDRYRAVNPNIGLIYALTEKTSIYGNVSRLYEPPTTFQLTDETASGANQELDAMRGTVAEIGTRGHYQQTKQLGWDWDISLYHAQIRDEILSTEPPGAVGTSQATNIDKTTHTGLEALLSADYQLDAKGTHSLNPVLSLTLNHFQFNDDAQWGNNDLPAAPDYALRGEVMYRHAKGFYAGPTIDVIGQRYADFANSFKIDNYVLMGLKAGWQNETQSLRVFAEVKNLFDRDHIATHSVRTTGSADADILYPGEPRSAYVGFEYRYW
ncbi:MAG: TonB-dependent receptor [Methylophaga sp.]|nr:TonB-dependent receptor [Methylophaga sp.]